MSGRQAARAAAAGLPPAGRSDRGAVVAYLQRPSGYSRAQVTRLGSISVGHLYNLRFRLLLGHAPVDVAFVQALLAQVLRGLVR